MKVKNIKNYVKTLGKVFANISDMRLGGTILLTTDHLGQGVGVGLVGDAGQFHFINVL